MTVEMEQPFVWPEEPTDLDAYVYPLGMFPLNLWSKVASVIQERLTVLQMG